MYVCVAYDISSNRLRLVVSRHCKRIGLMRFQHSMFVGKSTADALNELERDARALLSTTDRLVVLRLDHKIYQTLLRQTDDPAMNLLNEPHVNWYL